MENKYGRKTCLTPRKKDVAIDGTEADTVTDIFDQKFIRFRTSYTASLYRLSQAVQLPYIDVL